MFWPLKEHWKIKRFVKNFLENLIKSFWMRIIIDCDNDEFVIIIIYFAREYIWI